MASPYWNALVSGPYDIYDSKNQARRAVKIKFMECMMTPEQRELLGSKRVYSTTYARYVMECHLGRFLTRAENIEHKDGDVLNDDISNLEIVARTSAQRRWEKNLPEVSPNRIKKLAKLARQAEDTAQTA